MSQSIYRNLADKRKDARAIGQMVLGPVQIMNTLIIAPAAFCAAIAPLAVGIFFGQDWIEAGHYLRWMAPWVATTITFGAMSPVVSVLGLQKMGLVFQVGSLVLSLAALMLAGNAWGPVAAIAGFSITKALCIIAYRLHMFSLLHISPRPVAMSICLQTLGYVVAFILVERLLSDSAAQYSPWQYIAAAAILFGAVAVYAVFALRSARQLGGLRASSSAANPADSQSELDA